MRVEIIEEHSIWDLEMAINKILKNCNPAEIFDIKYSGSGNHATYSSDYYSAMIIFKR